MVPVLNGLDNEKEEMRLTSVQLQGTSPSLATLHKLQTALAMRGGKKETLQLREPYIHEILSPLGLVAAQCGFSIFI
jgi:hypothetical protein